MLANEEILRLLLDGIQDYAVYMLDPSGHVASWNAGALRLKGYSADEVLGQHISMFYGAADRALGVPERALQEALSAGRFEGEGLRTRKDGSTFWARVVILPMYDAAGKLRGFSKVLHDETERRRAAEALRLSDARREFALETAKLGDWELDLVTMQATRSLRHDEIFGYASLQQEWSFDIFLHHVHPDDRETVREDFQSCASQRKRWEFECRIVCPNGDRRWIWACGDYFREVSGTPTRMFGIIQDVTERRQAMEAMRESETRFHALANGIPQLAWMAEPDGHTFWYNQRWYEHTGTTFEQMEGWAWQSVYDPNILPEVMEKWKAAIADGQPLDMEFPLRGVDGRFRMFLTRVMPMKDSSGRVVRWFGTSTDISERKEAEQRMAEQAEELSRQSQELMRSQQALEGQTLMLRSVLDSMAEGLVAADDQGKFVIWNPSAERIMGRGATQLAPAEWVGHYDLYLADAVTPFPTDQLPLLRAIRGESSTTEMFVRNPEVEGGIWIEVNGGPLKNNEGVIRGGVVAFRDITEKRMAEKKIQKLNWDLEERVTLRTAQLESSNKELEAFTYSVSHDLRAPLRHISGFTRLLSEEYGSSLPSGGQHLLQRIQQGTIRMGLLVDDLLNLARLGRHELTLKMSNLRSVVDEVIAEMTTDCEDRQIEWRIASLPFVQCDPGLMKQVFQNLLLNAVKFTRPRAQAIIEIGKEEENGVLVFYVRDNGVGFNMKYVDKLFGVFQRLHRAEDFEGTGVGLATVQRIVQKHGGRIWVDAKLDQGATFYFTLGAPEKNGRKAKAATVGDEP